MPHEPSDLCLPIQPTADRRCASCRTVKPLNAFSAGYCASCRGRSVAVARRQRQRTLRQVARRAEAGYRALLAQHAKRGGGDGAA
jgi:hypothetical protein